MAPLFRALVTALALIAGPAHAICAAPPEEGKWTNTDRGGSPYALEIKMTSCGDQVLNGVQTTTSFTVTAFSRRSDNSLYRRDPVPAAYRTGNGGRSLVARINTGGYLDTLRIRRADAGRPQLVVDVFSKSLDSKPDASKSYRFEKGMIPPPPRPITPQPDTVFRPGPIVAVTPRPVSGSLTPFGLADWDDDGHQDIIVRNATGDLMLYPGESKRGYSQAQPVKIGNGWAGTTPFGIIDWDGDGHQDIIVRNPAGDLMLYPGESKRGYSQAQPVRIGNGWNGFTPFGLVDWDRDGFPDILGRNPAGDMMLYPGEGRRAYSQAQPNRIGVGWNGYTPFGTIDWDKDSKPDIVARDAAGNLWLYPGSAARTPSPVPRVQIGNGWSTLYPFGTADWDADGDPDILGRNPAGLLMLYPGQSKRGYSSIQPVQIGNGW